MAVAPSFYTPSVRSAPSTFVGPTLPEVAPADVLSTLDAAEGAQAYQAAQQATPQGAGSYLGPALGAYALYQMGKGWGKPNRSVGGVAGNTAGGALAGYTIGGPIGGVIGGLYGLGRSLIKSGKHNDQIARDQVRSGLQKAGVINNSYQLQNADGTLVDIGLDGGAKPDYSGGRAAYNVNTDNPFNTQAVGWSNVLSHMLTGGNKKLSSDFAGYFANASMVNAKTLQGVRANILGYMAQMKIDFNDARKAVTALHQQGVLSDGEYAADMASIDTLESGDASKFVTEPIKQPEAAGFTATEPGPVTGNEVQQAVANTSQEPTSGGAVQTPRIYRPGTDSSMQKAFDQMKDMAVLTGQSGPGWNNLSGGAIDVNAVSNRPITVPGRNRTVMANYARPVAGEVVPNILAPKTSSVAAPMTPEDRDIAAFYKYVKGPNLATVSSTYNQSKYGKQPTGDSSKQYYMR